MLRPRELWVVLQAPLTDVMIFARGAPQPCMNQTLNPKP